MPKISVVRPRTERRLPAL